MGRWADLVRRDLLRRDQAAHLPGCGELPVTLEEWAEADRLELAAARARSCARGPTPARMGVAARLARMLCCR